jgi:hypothetical protein
LVRHVAPGFIDGAAIAWPVRDGAGEIDAQFGAWLEPSSGPFVILHLADESDVRAWPAAAFIELARDLAADHDVLVLAGPAEEAQGREAARSLHGVARVRCVPAQRGLSALAAGLRAAADRGSVFVGCDSGPMHMAWSSGLSVVLLAGPQDERRTGPWPVPGSQSEVAARHARADATGPASAAGIAYSTRPASATWAGCSSAHRVVRSASSPACAPCRSRSCSHAEGPVCMTRLAPAAAAESVRALTRERARASAHTGISARPTITASASSPAT